MHGNKMFYSVARGRQSVLQPRKRHHLTEVMRERSVRGGQREDEIFELLEQK